MYSHLILLQHSIILHCEIANLSELEGWLEQFVPFLGCVWCKTSFGCC